MAAAYAIFIGSPLAIIGLHMGRALVRGPHDDSE